MEDNRALSAIGLCRRAGKCVMGDYAVERAIKARRVYLVVLDAAASEATKRRYRALCERTEIPYMELTQMGKAIGKPDGRIAAVADRGFAGMIAKASSKENG